MIKTYSTCKVLRGTYKIQFDLTHFIYKYRKMSLCYFNYYVIMRYVNNNRWVYPNGNLSQRTSIRNEILYM